MYSFKNDYSEGVHPNILQSLQEVNDAQMGCYGFDSYSLEAQKLIRELIQYENADIHFVTSGTQANLVLLSSVLRPHESVISAETGHIAVHECGAIESTGHKINTVQTENGKLQVKDIDQVLSKHCGEHMVKPKLVFISNSTELGTIYTKDELKALSKFCKENQLFLYLDGARLGAAMVSKENDLEFSDLPKYVDAFYIGGAKNGGMLGEAIVLINPNFFKDFRFLLKQKGALVSKSCFLGLQFREFFTNNLYFENAKRANLLAYKMAEGLKKAGYSFLTQSSTNMLFPILPNSLIEKLLKKFDFYITEAIDENHSAVRLVTSWATEEKMVDLFLKEIKKN